MLGVARRGQERLETSLVALRCHLFEAAGLRWRGFSARRLCPELASRGGFSLAYDDRLFPRGHYRVTVPDLPLQHLAEPSSGPFGLRFFADPVCPGVGNLNTACPLPDSSPTIPGSPPISASPSGSQSPPDLCVRSDLLPGSSPSEPARSPLSFRFGTPTADGGRGPLPLWRLAVLQTSWNQFNSPSV
jgi:hypothetical protein